MGRKPIPQSQRAQPISFSLKPRLIDEIDDYAHDLRFSRSKFLMEAVNHYMLQQKMGYLEESSNVHNMSTQRKVIVGANALQEANREGEEIAESVIELLRNQLAIYDTKSLVRQIDAKEGRTSIISAPSATESDSDIHFDKVRNESRYRIFNNGTTIGRIFKAIDGQWTVEIGDDEVLGTWKTLKAAKAAVLKEWE